MKVRRRGDVLRGGGVRVHAGLALAALPARRRADGSSYSWIAAETGVVNQFYCYCVDGDFGPFFLKFCSYFPFNAKLYQRQRVGQAAGRQGWDRLHPDG